MGVNLHPSQKRSSCEACRKHKLRCKREEPNLGRCTRCARLNLDCVLGQQKKVGRPRRSPTESTPPTNNSPTAPADLADFEMMGASSLDFTQDFGNFDSSLSAPNLDPFFMDAPNIGLGAPGRPSLMEFAFGMGDGSLPWDAMSSDPFQTASSGSSTTWNSSPSPSATTPSSSGECGFSGMTPELNRFMTAPEPPIEIGDAMSSLSQINLDLHLRTRIIESEGENINFLTIVCSEGPLYIDNISFVQFMVATTQEFVKVLGRLRATRQSQESVSPPPVRSYLNYGLLSPFAQASAVEPSSLVLPGSESEAALSTETSMHRQASPAAHSLIKREVVSLPASLLITSIFVQLICLFEVMLHHVHQRMSGDHANIVPDMKWMSMGGILMKDSCSLGIVFSELVNTLLQRSERILGTEPFTVNGELGLLSQGQKETLWRELGGVGGPGAGKMRTLNVRMGLDTAKKMFLEAAMSR